MWEEWEKDLVRKYYPRIGAAGIVRRELLPHRTHNAIMRRAAILGVKYYGQNEATDQREHNARIRKTIGITDPLMKRAVCGRWT